jgi:hypothetical protein
MPSTVNTRLEFWATGVACRLGPAIAFLLPNVPEGLPAPFHIAHLDKLSTCDAGSSTEWKLQEERKSLLFKA